MSVGKYLRKDFTADKTFNSFFILCATLGIIGLLLVETFKEGIENKISENAKNFIAADLSITSRTQLSNEQQVKVQNYLNEHKLKYTHWVELYSLISNLKQINSKEGLLSKLSDLNFVGEEFPYYGELELEDRILKKSSDWNDLHLSPTVYINRDLAWELNVKKGDKLKIGETNFNIIGIIIKDQFSGFRGFNIAPKIFISYKYLPATQLIKTGSTASFSYSIKIPNELELRKIQNELKDLISDRSVKIYGPVESSQQLGRSINLLTDYLSLITLLTYLLSLVGMYYFTQHYLAKKIHTFSIYKSLGIRISKLFKYNFSHILILTLFSIILSSGAVLILIPILQKTLLNALTENVAFSVTWKSLLKIFGLSFGGSMLALGPLFWGALQTPVATIFQDLPRELKRIKFYYFFPLIVYIILLAVILSNSFRTGIYFISALTVIAILSAILFKIIMQFLDKQSLSLSFINRHIVRTINRYFVSSFTVFICLLLGMTLSIFVIQLENSLRLEFTNTNSNRPDLFMFDLQDIDEGKFQSLAKSENWNLSMFSPMVRGRLLKINNDNINTKIELTEKNFETREDQSEKAMKNRGVNLSYREKISWSETVTDGIFNGKKCRPELSPCEISLESSYAKRLGIKLNDKLVFEVSSVEVEGIVKSFRKVKWTSFEPNFFILFQPGVLEEAPKTFLTSIKVKSLEQKRNIFNKVALNFPNVSIIEVSEVISKITKVFDLMAMAIKTISLLALFVAIVVLISVSLNHLTLRKKEMSLYYMFGLKSDVIKKIFLKEFLLIILFGSVLSFIFGSILTSLIMNLIFNSEVVFRPKVEMIAIIMLVLSLYTIVKIRLANLLKNLNLF
jgi:putative ABC transport system permease protein